MPALPRRARLRALGVPLAIVLLIGVSLPCSAATYSGTLAVTGVVWISDGSRPTALPESAIHNTHKSFVPDLLVVTVGSAVRFPNDDQFFHSIYSDGGPDPFDIGFYDNGPGKVVLFPQPGVVPLRCHIHGTMHATIIVVDGPWAQTHAPNEQYTLTDVRPGNHVLHVWSLDGGEKTSTVKI